MARRVTSGYVIAERSSAVPSDASGSWIVTFTGKKFYPLDPDPLAIDPMDIAVSLSRTVRWRGFTRDFFSVAQHSVLVSEDLADRGFALAEQQWGLMHDASEAYIGDLPRPIKQQIPAFKTAENKILQAVAGRFDLPWPIPKEVHWVDNVMLVTESAVLMTHHPEGWHLKYDYKPDPNKEINPVPEHEAYVLWMKRYLELFA